MKVKLDGYVPDPRSSKDYSFDAMLAQRLPAVSSNAVADMRPFTSRRHNQRTTGTCVAQSVIKALEVLRIKKWGRDKHVDLSTLALYYLARERMFPQQHDVDEGTQIRLACEVLKLHGVSLEKDWPFDPKNVNENIPLTAMRSARLHKLHSYYRITSTKDERIESISKALVAGHPVVFGTKITNQWTQYNGVRAEDPLLPVEGQEVIGAHATVLLGRRSDGLYIGENSWGTPWGVDGFYTLHPEVLVQDAWDIWAIAGGWEPHVKELSA